MLRPFLTLALLLVAMPAAAAERTYAIGSFDRVRIDGPFDVRLTVGKSPGARAQGDAEATDQLDIRVEGTTLVIRAANNNWGERPAGRGAAAPVILASTPSIRGVVTIGGGRLTIAGPIKGQRIDLALTGSGSITTATLDADQLTVSLLGSGKMILGGRAQRARLTSSGSGVIAAGALSAGDLDVRLDGTGETQASARFTANVATTGIGGVTVYGKPACTVHAQAGGPVSCGQLAVPPAPE